MSREKNYGKFEIERHWIHERTPPVKLPKTQLYQRLENNSTNESAMEKRKKRLTASGKIKGDIEKLIWTKSDMKAGNRKGGRNTLQRNQVSGK